MKKTSDQAFNTPPYPVQDKVEFDRIQEWHAKGMVTLVFENQNEEASSVGQLVYRPASSGYAERKPLGTTLESGIILDAKHYVLIHVAHSIEDFELATASSGEADPFGEW